MEVSDLQAAREAIEKIDHDLMALLRERMDLVEVVANLKLEKAFPFRDPPREEQVLQRVRHSAAEAGLDPHEIERLYRLIMEMSIAHQVEHIRSSGRTPLRVAYQGVEGAFSHVAAQRHYRDRAAGTLLTGFETFRGAADAVRDGSADLALLPIENSTAGSINETYDLLAVGGLAITAEVISHVEHCLLGVPGASVDDLELVLSHPQALAQCEGYLHDLPKIRTQDEFDTAGSARKVKESNDRTLGAIASESAGRALGLEVLARGIQSESGNFTRFVEVALEAATCPPDQPCKTSLMLTTGDHAGELGQLLTEFSQRSINLTKLESRPIPARPWQYRFYLDVQGHAASAPVAEALDRIRKSTFELLVLGTYPSAEPEPAPD
jgi:chorismate mutase/prephenate dehydratase